MEKAFLFLLLAVSSSATALAQPKPKKRVVPPLPPIAPHKDLKIPEPLLSDVAFDAKNLTFEWINNV